MRLSVRCIFISIFAFAMGCTSPQPTPERSTAAFGDRPGEVSRPGDFGGGPGRPGGRPDGPDHGGGPRLPPGRDSFVVGQRDPLGPGTFVIGGTRISNGSEFTAVRVDTSYVTSVSLCAQRDDLNLESFTVEFNNGGTQTVLVRNIIPRGACTFWSDLIGDVRSVRNIYIHAVSGWDWRGRDTSVMIFGRVEIPLQRDGRTLVGATQMAPGRDFDELNLDAQHVSSIMLCPTRDDLQLISLRVRFGNDSEQQLVDPRRGLIIGNNSCQSWDLAGDVRNIRKIFIGSDQNWRRGNHQTNVLIYAQEKADSERSRDGRTGRLLAATSISNGVERESIELDRALKLKEVMICAQGDDLNVGRAAVQFRDGTRGPLSIRETKIARGHCSTWLNVSTDGRERGVRALRILASSDWDSQGVFTKALFYGR